MEKYEELDLPYRGISEKFPLEDTVKTHIDVLGDHENRLLKLEGELDFTRAENILLRSEIRRNKSAFSITVVLVYALVILPIVIQFLRSLFST